MNGIKNLPTLYWKCDISVSEVSPLSIQTPLHKALLKWTKMNQLDWNGTNRSVWNKWTEMDWVDWCRPKWTKNKPIGSNRPKWPKNIFEHSSLLYLATDCTDVKRNFSCKAIWLRPSQMHDFYIFQYMYIFVLRSKCRANIT